MNINDCIHAALGPGQINDLLLQYYLDNGATTPQINDAAYEFLIAQGATPGHLADMWYEFLRGRGYEGARNDMLKEFWCVDGGVLDSCMNWEYCLHVEFSEGTSWGYDTGTGVGIIVPGLFEGEIIYRLTGDSGAGPCVIAFGAAGLLQIPGVLTIYVQFNGFPGVHAFDWVSTQYEIVNAALGVFLSENDGETVGVRIATSEEPPIEENAVLYNGEIVEHNGEAVTHG